MPIWNAENKFEYERLMREAKAQELKVNASYIAYHAKAKLVDKLFTENNNEVPAKGTAEDKTYRLAVNAKQVAYVAWQREAQKHGAMFVDLSRPADPEYAARQETVW